MQRHGFNLPNERQQDYCVDEKQLFLRPYADDLIKMVLTCLTNNVKIYLAANLPRDALIKLMVQMSTHKKLSFLGLRAPQPDQGTRAHWHPNRFSEGVKLTQFHGLLDNRFFSEEGKLNIQSVFGKSFKNSRNQVIFVGTPEFLNLDPTDSMLPPAIIPFQHKFTKQNVISPLLDKNYHFLEI